MLYNGLVLISLYFYIFYCIFFFIYLKNFFEWECANGVRILSRIQIRLFPWKEKLVNSQNSPRVSPSPRVPEIIHVCTLQNTVIFTRYLPSSFIKVPAFIFFFHFIRYLSRIFSENSRELGRVGTFCDSFGKIRREEGGGKGGK